MVNFRFILVFILLCCSCSDDTTVEHSKEPSNKYNVQTEDTITETQVFEINNTRKVTIKGKEGTLLEFPRGVFTCSEGEFDTSKIKVKIKECYKIKDIVLNELSTTTIDGKPLSTRGMVYISAESEGKKLDVKKGRNFTIGFPVREKKEEGFQLFMVNSSNKSYWNTMGVKDEFSETNFGISARYLNSDTIVPDSILNNIDEIKAKSLDFYLFKSVAMNWLNCDEYMDDTTLTNILVNFKAEYKPVIRLIYPENKAILIGRLENNSLISFKNVPKASQILLFAFSKQDGKYYKYSEKIELLENKELDINLEETTLKSIENELNAVKWW